MGILGPTNEASVGGGLAEMERNASVEIKPKAVGEQGSTISAADPFLPTGSTQISPLSPSPTASVARGLSG